MKPGDVVRWAFVQGDGQRKFRPAIVLGEVPPYKDWLVCAVSSQVQREVKGLDLLINEQHPDFEISYSSGETACDLLLSVQDLPERDPVLFPNPGTSHFTLSGVEGSLPPGPHTITLFDAMGRVVLEQRTTDARPVINTEALPAGLYRISVSNERGAVTGATWVKER